MAQNTVPELKNTQDLKGLQAVNWSTGQVGTIEYIKVGSETSKHPGEYYIHVSGVNTKSGRTNWWWNPKTSEHSFPQVSVNGSVGLNMKLHTLQNFTNK